MLTLNTHLFIIYLYTILRALVESIDFGVSTKCGLLCVLNRSFKLFTALPEKSFNNFGARED